MRFAGVLFLFLSIAAKAQFTQIPVGNSEPQSIYFFNQQVGFLGGLTIERTTDGGQTWIANSFSSPDSLFYQYLYNYHFFFFDAQHGVAVASSLLTASGAVVKTDDGGKTWKSVFIDASFTSVPYLGFTDVHFFDSNNGFAVGGAGRRIITTDGGNTWVRNDLPVAADFWDIFFVNSSIGFISGQGHVLKTTNGGATWQDHVVGQNGDIIKSIYFTDALTGYAVSSAGYIFKSIDGGATWSTYFISYYQLNKITFTDANTGYIAGSATDNHNVLRTINGGDSWERTEQAFPCTLYDITFLNANKIVTCGTNFFGGVSYYGMTTAGVGSTIPQAYFTYTPPASTCPGFTVDFSNKGDPAYSHYWSVNSSLLSTDYNFQYQFSKPGSYAVQLITINHGVSSSYYAYFNVDTPETLPPISLTYQNRVCAGAYWDLQVNGYPVYTGSPRLELWANGTKLDITRIFDHVVPAYEIIDTTVFTLKIFADLHCVGSIEKDTSFVVAAAPRDYKPDVEASGLAICPGVPFSFKVHHSNPYLYYYYYGDLGDSGEGKYGNGGDLVIPVATWQFYGGNYIVAGNQTLCQFKSDPFNLVRSPIKAQFSINDIALFQDEALVTSDASIGTLYSWNFGPTGQPQSSNQPSPPNVGFNSTGLKKITLHLEDQYHCKASKDTLIFIAERVAGDPVLSCGETTNALTYLEKVIESKSDSLGNVFTVGIVSGPVTPPQEYPDPGHNNVFIEKSDAAGNLLWHKEAKSQPGYGYFTYFGSNTYGMAVDGAGNVYVGINYDGPEVIIGGVTLKDYHYGPTAATVLCKFSPTGELLWHIFLFDDSPNHNGGLRPGTLISAITIDRRGDILFDVESFTTATRMELPNGDRIYGSMEGGFSIVTVDKDGRYIKDAPYIAEVALTQFTEEWAFHKEWPLVGPKLFADEANHIIFSGTYYGQDEQTMFGNFVMPGSDYGFTPRFFNAILKDGRWTAAFGGSQLKTDYAAPSITTILASDAEQAIYLTGPVNNQFGIFLVNGDTIDSRKVSGYLIRWKYNGSIDWIKYTDNMSIQSLTRNPVNGSIQAGGTIDHFGVFDATSVHPKGIRSNGLRDPFSLTFDNSGTPISGVTGGTAADEYSNFQLASGCGQFTFASAQQDAVVIRKSSTTGSCGQSLPPLAVQSSLVTICKGSDAQLQATGTGAYSWQPSVGLNNNTIGNPLASPTETTVYTVTGYTDMNCLSKKQVRVVVQDPVPTFTVTRKNRLVHFKTESQPGDTFTWAFGDGAEGSSNEVAHTYTQSGTYSVCLTTNNQCGVQTACQDVVIDCTQPIPFILLINVGDNYAADFGNYNDPEYTLHWDFGDGGTSDLPGPTHVYHREGPFNICLTASNECADSTYCTILEMGCLQFVPDFVAESNHNDGVHFVNQSTNSYLYQWDFGDGTTSTEENPIHAYQTAGSYQVCLSSGNKCGYSNPVCKQVTGKVAVVTGIANVQEDIRAFPNPFHNQFSLAVPSPQDIQEIEIVNNLGQVVHRITEINSMNQINLSHCSTGLYHVRIRMQNETASQSVIKLD